MKPEHIRLGDFSHLFTDDFIALGLASLKDSEIKRPSFMYEFPGIFRKGKFGLEYVNSENVARTIVPQSKREALLNTLWGLRDIPRGQESFHNYVAMRFIGVQARFIRDFVGSKPAMQMIRNLQHKTSQRRAVRGRIPFSHISCDLADMVSFGDQRGAEEERFVFVLCDDFSGYMFAKLLPHGKDGKGVSVVFSNILKKIQKLGGAPRILTSDLGSEFFNTHFQAVCAENNIKHIKPHTARMAPYIENRIRHWKRYVRLNSHLLFKDTHWYEPEIIRDSARAVNNIQRESKYSAREIVNRWRKKEPITDIRISYRNDEKKETRHVGVSTLNSGDFVRIRVAPEKTKLDYKSHLGFKGDSDFKTPISWSVKIYRVIKQKQMRVRRTSRFQLNNKKWYDRSELLKIPAGSEEKITRMPRSIPEKISPIGRRSSRLAEKKRSVKNK